MENFMMIDGRRIELSDKTVEDLKKAMAVNEKDRYLELRNKDEYNSLLFEGKAKNVVQIGKGCAPKGFQDKCLIVQNGYTPMVHSNKEDDSFPCYITFEKDE